MRGGWGIGVEMVEPAGFELATPWSQTKCATSCATARHFNETTILIQEYPTSQDQSLMSGAKR